MDFIRGIKIRNCKGYFEEELKIELLDCSHKKPNIFVAKNGFGKSTITKAFEYTIDKKLMEKDSSEFLLEIETSDSVSTQRLKTTNKANEFNISYVEAFTINYGISLIQYYIDFEEIPEISFFNKEDNMATHTICECCELIKKLYAKKINGGFLIQFQNILVSKQ